MSDLTSMEKLKFEKLLGMDTGYVLEFTNRTFAQFDLEYTGIEIYDEKYNYDSGSKANRLRAFWDKESNYIVAKLLEKLLDQWASIHHLNSHAEGASADKVVYSQCLQAVERLKQNSLIENVDVIQPNTNEKSFEALANVIRKSIERNEPETALDRLHTFVVKYIRGLNKRHSIAFNKNTPLHSLFGGYVKFLKENNLIDSEMTERILKASISVLEAFNDVRNNQSFAHDNSLLNYNESVLIFNNISNTIRFIESIEKKLADQQKKRKEHEIDWQDIPYSDEEVEAAGDAWMEMESDRMRGR